VDRRRCNSSRKHVAHQPFGQVAGCASACSIAHVQRQLSRNIGGLLYLPKRDEAPQRRSRAALGSQKPAHPTVSLGRLFERYSSPTSRQRSANGRKAARHQPSPKSGSWSRICMTQQLPDLAQRSSLALTSPWQRVSEYIGPGGASPLPASATRVASVGDTQDCQSHPRRMLRINSRRLVQRGSVLSVR